MWVPLRPIANASIRPQRLILAVAGLLVFFFGCTVGPDYVRPPTETPGAYKENAGWKVAQPKDELPRGKWWEIYGDPRLNALEEQVEISNQNIAQAEANFRQALALIRVARSAYFPAAGAGPSWSRFKRSENLGSKNTNLAGASGTGGGSSIGTFPGATLNDFLLTSDVTWELDTWGKVRRSVEASKASAQATAATLEGIRLSAQATLAQNYFLLRALDEQKRLFNATVAAYRQILELTKNRYARGVVSRAYVLQAETQLKTTQAQAIDLGVQRAQLEHAIAVLLGKPASTFAIPEARLTLTVPPVPAGLPSDLLERRPDIAAAQTIFQGGALVAQTDAARAGYDATLASYRQTVLTGFQEVEDNLAGLRILENEGQVQDGAIKSARESVTVSTNQYRAGTISHLDLMVVETVALNNERTAVTILGNRLSASVLLIKALGGGWKAGDLPPLAWPPLQARPKTQAVINSPEKPAGPDGGK